MKISILVYHWQSDHRAMKVVNLIHNALNELTLEEIFALSDHFDVMMSPVKKFDPDCRDKVLFLDEKGRRFQPR